MTISCNFVLRVKEKHFVSAFFYDEYCRLTHVGTPLKIEYLFFPAMAVSATSSKDSA